MKYRDVPFWKFALAAMVVSVPAFVLEGSDRRFAWYYVLLIVVMLLVYYNDGIARTANFINGEFRAR